MPLLTELDVLRIREAYPSLDVAPLTSQQERAAIGICRGLTPMQACRSAGMSVKHARETSSDLGFLSVCDYLAEFHYGLEQREAKITRDGLNNMLLESHRKAANSMEEISAIRELGKMNDLYLDSRNRAGITIAVRPEDVTSEKQLERLDDSELIELSGADYRLCSEDKINE